MNKQLHHQIMATVYLLIQLANSDIYIVRCRALETSSSLLLLITSLLVNSLRLLRIFCGFSSVSQNT